MVDKQSNRDELDAIAPASVNLNAPAHDPDRPARAPLWRQYSLAMAALAVMLLAAVAVVFYLPSAVSPVQSRNTTAGAAQPKVSPTANTVTESPWQDAQIARARREAQEILQQLLEQQEKLEAMRVDLWAAEGFAAALATAGNADREYQRREFARALALYQESLKQMQALEKQSEQVFAAALEVGNRAIDEGDQPTAQNQFQLAAHINAEHEAVKTGLKRAAALKTVLAEIAAGQTLQRQGKLDEARARYKKALELDQQSRQAREKLTAVDRAIADRDFGRHMSAGFAAMASASYQEAIAAFEQAQAIRPDAADAKAALVQARNQDTQSRLQSLLQKAQQHEQNEEWRAATDLYQEALKIDANLVDARVGSIRAGTRAEIDENLERILAAPQRLTTPTVHQEYTRFLDETRRISQPGPRLQRQLQELEQALQLAVQPVTVRFRSDNATRVTVYKVAELGSFAERELSLKPGRYTLVGVRPGYRDVRQTFTVTAGGNDAPVITIQCEEKINEG